MKASKIFFLLSLARVKNHSHSFLSESVTLRLSGVTYYLTAASPACAYANAMEDTAGTEAEKSPILNILKY